MTFKKIIILSLILCGLGFYISQVELASDIHKAQVEHPFAKTSAQSIQSIDVKSKDGEFSLVNSKPVTSSSDSNESPKMLSEEQLSAWGVKGIAGADLDRANFNTFLSALQALTLDTTITAEEAGSDMSVFGLGQPELQLTVTELRDNASKKTELQFGKLSEYLSKRYLRITDVPGLYLVSQDLFSTANKKVDDFRNRSPVQVFETDLRSIDLSDGDLVTRLESDGKGNWKITKPELFTGSGSAISTLLRDARNIRATGFVDDATQKSKYGLDKPTFTVRFEYSPESKRSPVVLQGGSYAGADGKDAYAFMVEGRPAIYTIDTNPRSKFIKSVAEYREKRLAQYSTDQAAKISIEPRGKEAIILTKQGTEWMHGDKKTDQPFVLEYLRTVSELEAEAFPGPGVDFGFASPQGKVVITLANNLARTVVIGANASADRVYIGVDGGKEPFLVDAQKIKKLLPDAETFDKKG